MLANGSFIAIPETSGGANDAGSVANSPHDTPSVTPTKHLQHKVTFCALSVPSIRANVITAIHCSTRAQPGDIICDCLAVLTMMEEWHSCLCGI